MNPIFAAALEVQNLCRARAWPFCFIGGLAVQRWGEPRLTQDVDLTILTGFGREQEFVDPLLELLASRLPDARDFALRNRVLLVKSAGGIPIDIALGALPFEQRLVARASSWVVAEDVDLRTCGAEDLIVMKAFANRDRDWADIEGILQRCVGRLDEGLVWKEILPLLELKGERAAEGRLQTLFGRSQP